MRFGGRRNSENVEFREGGVDVVETATFGAFAVPLAEYGIADKSHEINLRAAQIAREVADGHGGFVAGSMGPGTKFASLGQIRFAVERIAAATSTTDLGARGVGDLGAQDAARDEDRLPQIRSGRDVGRGDTGVEQASGLVIVGQRKVDGGTREEHRRDPVEYREFGQQRVQEKKIRAAAGLPVFDLAAVYLVNRHVRLKDA